MTNGEKHAADASTLGSTSSLIPWEYGSDSCRDSENPASLKVQQTFDNALPRNVNNTTCEKPTANKDTIGGETPRGDHMVGLDIPSCVVDHSHRASDQDDAAASTILEAFGSKASIDSGESDSSLKTVSSYHGGNSRRGSWMSTKRLSHASMPSLKSIDENHGYAYLFDDSISSFLQFSGEGSTPSFIDDSIRTAGSLDESGTHCYNSSMPSLRSFCDHEESQVLLYDVSQSFTDSFSNDLFPSSSLTVRRNIQSISVDRTQPFSRVDVFMLDQNDFAVEESIIKPILSPPCATKLLQGKISEKQCLRWDTSGTSAGLPNLVHGKNSPLLGGRRSLSFTDAISSLPFLGDDCFLEDNKSKNTVEAVEVQSHNTTDFHKASRPSSRSGDTCPRKAVRQPSITAVTPLFSCESVSSSVEDDWHVLPWGLERCVLVVVYSNADRVSNKSERVRRGDKELWIKQKVQEPGTNHIAT